MKRPRPALLLALALPLLLGPSPAGSPLRSGPMLGYAELTEATVWLQTSKDAEVRLRYYPDGRAGDAKTTEAIRADASGSHTATFVISGLAPATTYRYEISIDGRTIPSDPAWRFATQPYWQYRSAPPSFSAAFGSCYFANDPAADRPGRPYGGDPAIFEKIADTRPDLMLWIGDNVYLREPDFGSAAAIFERYAKAREEPRLRRLLAATRHYATWDDHDYGPNNAGWTYRLSEAALDAFRRFWANPASGHREIRGVFFQFSWADADFFMLDDRWNRTPEGAADTAGRRMFGADQLRWLKDALLESSSPFKIVVSGSQVLNANTKFDTFVHFPTEYRDLMSWITTNKVNGVVFLSGDRHISELLRETPRGFYTLYDFTSSPLTARSWGGEEERGNPQRVPGTRIENSRSWGNLRFSGPCNDRVLTMEAFDETGAKRWTHALKARDLYPPGTAEKDKVGHFGCRWLKEAR